MNLKIFHLYPDLLNLYGDRGNIMTLLKRCQWRGIEAQVVEFTRDRESDLAEADILFIGGGSDREQEILYKHLADYKGLLKSLIEDGLATLTICGGYQLLGAYYLDANGAKIDGLSILEFYTRAEKGRLIGNVAAELSMPLSPSTIVGFENHGGRTYHNYTPLAKVLKGNGNNGKDQTEGLLYKNCIGSYFHGPMLPKNPQIADFLIQKALERKYKKPFELKPLDDTIETAAHESVFSRIVRGK